MNTKVPINKLLDFRVFNPLKMLRAEKGLTQKEVCEKLGVTLKTLRAWEKGKQYPEGKMIVDLAMLFGVSSDYILCLSEHRHVGNAEISAFTGLTENSINVLRFLNGQGVTNEEDQLYHHKIINLINAVLESSYSDMLEYKKMAEEWLHLICTQNPGHIEL